MRVTITVADHGQRYAFAGQVRARGRILATCQDRPYGFAAAALADARDWAVSHGHEVIEDLDGDIGDVGGS